MTSVKRLLLAGYCKSPLRRLSWPLTRSRLVIFMLHRFWGPDGHDPDLLSRNLRVLREDGCQFWPLADALRALRTDPSRLYRAVSFTVDDGYWSFGEVGWHVFRAARCPVTVFLATGFLDGTTWLWYDQVEFAVSRTQATSLSVALGREKVEFSWNDERSRSMSTRVLVDLLKRVPNESRVTFMEDLPRALDIMIPQRPPRRYAPLSWSEVRRLASEGCTFGAHGVTHGVLARMSRQAAEDEIAKSWGRLREHVPDAVPVFCYPNGRPGDYGTREAEVLRRLGLDFALGTHDGYVSSEDTRHPIRRYALPRFPYLSDPNSIAQVAGGLEYAKILIRRVLSSGSSRKRLSLELD